MGNQTLEQKVDVINHKGEPCWLIDHYILCQEGWCDGCCIARFTQNAGLLEKPCNQSK